MTCSVLDTVEIIDCREGTFQVDWPAVRRIVASENRGRLMNSMAYEEEIERDIVQKIFDNPVKVLTVDWSSLRQQTDLDTQAEMLQSRNRLLTHVLGMSDYRQKLRGDWTAGEREKAVFHTRRQALSMDAMRTIHKNVEGWKSRVGTAKFVRDTSFGAVIVGGVVISGGAGAGLVGVAAAGKGVGKGQDVFYDEKSKLKAEDRLGRAIASGTIEATMSFATAFIPGGGPAAQQGVVLFLDMSTTAAQSLVEGKTVQDALVDAGWKAGTFGLGKLVKTDAVTKRMRNMAFPVVWQLGGEGAGLKASVKMARAQGEFALGRGLDTAVSAFRGALDAAGSKTNSVADRVTLGGSLELCDKLLANSIVQLSQSSGAA